MLRRNDLNVRWFNPAGGWVWPAGPGPVTYYFPTDPLGPQSFDPTLERLFAADVAPLPVSSDNWMAFRLARSAALEERLEAATAAALAWPPDLGSLPAPSLPLSFDGRLTLLGVEQLDAAISVGGEVRLVTYWQVKRADPTPVVAFVHLTADGQDIWGQVDWLDVWPEGLQRGDRFAQVHRVPTSAETPVGRYYLQLGLYNPATLQRLPIIVGDESQADRVWVGEVVVHE